MALKTLVFKLFGRGHRLDGAFDRPIDRLTIRPFLLLPVPCTENSPQIVKGFRDGEFAAIIHDPPARALCKTTDMYGAAFYKDLARVLKPGGTLFHYIGNPESR